MGGFQHWVPCAWQQLWLAIEQPWSPLAGPFLALGAMRMAAAYMDTINSHTVSFSILLFFSLTSALLREIVLCCRCLFSHPYSQKISIPLPRTQTPSGADLGTLVIVPSMCIISPTSSMRANHGQACLEHGQHCCPC